MGQARLPVDPAQYEKVRERLADPMLCGVHIKQSPPLPPPLPPPDAASTKLAAQRPAKKPRAERFEVESVVGEEPPSREVWHRYLVQWKGYQPEWEEWRIPGRGTPGSGPIETWEKASRVRKLWPQAVAAWEAAKAAQTAAEATAETQQA
jgi:hypothetical protein